MLTLMSVTQTLAAVSVLWTCCRVGQLTASSDPVAAMCSPMCTEFQDVANECTVRRKCYDYINDDTMDTFYSCAEPCWDLSAGCFGLCSDNWRDMYEKCETDCAGDSDDFGCFDDCFSNTFSQKMEDNSLTVPSPDVGPFVKE